MVFINYSYWGESKPTERYLWGPHIVKVMVIYHDKNQDKMTIYKITNLP